MMLSDNSPFSSLPFPRFPGSPDQLRAKATIFLKKSFPKKVNSSSERRERGILFLNTSKLVTLRINNDKLTTCHKRRMESTNAASSSNSSDSMDDEYRKRKMEMEMESSDQIYIHPQPPSTSANSDRRFRGEETIYMPALFLVPGPEMNKV